MHRRLRTTALAVLALTLTGAALTATAQAASPTVATRTAASVNQTAATLRGTVNPRGEATTYSFQWGTSASYGAQTPNRSAGRGTSGKNVSARLTGLTPGTVYHYRVVATNASGTTVGADRSFTTKLPPAVAPTILGTAPFSPFANSVTLTGLLNPGGAQTTYRFQFGTTTAYGLETASKVLPAGVVPQSVQIPVSGLQARMTYHFRLVASNRITTVIGPDTTFTTGPFPPAKIAASSRPKTQRRSHPYFVVTSILRLPPGVGVANGCTGIVGVRFTSGERTMSFHRKRLAAGHCAVSLRMRALPPSGKSKLRVHVHFYGNSILTPQDAKSFLVSFK